MKTDAGLSLVEMLCALVIFALAVAASLSLYVKASSNQSALQLQADLTAVHLAVKSVHHAQSGFGFGDLNPILIASGRIPSTMKVSGKHIIHALDGQLRATGNGASFSVTLTNIPAIACTSMLTSAQDWKKILVVGGSEKTAIPLSSSAAATECEKGTSIVFTSQ